jgi:hypothetical protein
MVVTHVVRAISILPSIGDLGSAARLGTCFYGCIVRKHEVCGRIRLAGASGAWGRQPRLIRGSDWHASQIDNVVVDLKIVW